ncbi:hypothetical protein SAMN02745121_01460 [Nannocystis exedens]|uniref:Uncharacterized protein n=1 Tax=Nannocystis exedens TaxID=54 RepID=A0A1I1V612_9BACT|nr:hypothetical protein [Nannocystis exedens]PCC72260.1 hypothetical protein NAEX_05339 [Nannocystis exedens]SFD76523.1 hypothetical protein SAMN02745121_01460 [Nannocystis exedens]
MSPLARPRRLSLLVVVLTGCPPVYKPGATTAETTTTGTTTGGTTEPVEPTGSGTTIATTTVGTGTTTTGAVDTTTGEPGTTTGEPATTTTGEATTTTGTTGDPDPGLMGEWGHACQSDDECAAILGDKGVCLTDILMLYSLPGGYCTKECTLPDAMTFYEPGDPACAPDAMCIGASGYFEACAVECTDDSDCPREGYECRLMPQIGQPGDPMFCLMTDEYML